MSNNVFAQDTLRHSIEFNQRYENFTKNNTYRLYSSVQYGYKVANKHDVFGRLVYQNRNGEKAIQTNVDFYPTYKRGYMFFSLRHSNSILFPQTIAMGEIYSKVFEKHEASIGIRYLRPFEKYNIYVITGTYGIYHGNWFTYTRPMMNILEDGISWSGMIVTRRYFGSGKTYIEATFLKGEDTGTSRAIGAIENSFGGDTYLFRLKSTISLPKNYSVSIGTDYAGISLPKANGGTNEITIWGIDVILTKKFN